MRNIKQLGFVSNIYPSATHTRFEHSIGTLSITWEILKRLLKVLEENGEESIIEAFADDGDIIHSVRLAALLHDIGHGPFSHALEDALRYLEIKFKHDELTSYLLSLRLRKEEQDSIKPSFSVRNQPKKLSDSRKELAEILNLKLRRMILSIMDSRFRSTLVPQVFEKISLFLHEILKGDIGADRIDYLLRDTYFTGLGHRFSLSEILDNLYYICDKRRNKYILAIREDGKDALELMLLTRYFHYQFIAHHPDNVEMMTILQPRIESYMEKGIKRKTKRKKERKFLEIALSNDWIENDFRTPDVFRSIHRVSLLDFQDFASRFLFYRIIEDFDLRLKLQNDIKGYIKSKYHINVEGSLLFNFTVGKPRIPIFHYYMKRYTKGSVKKSALIHDHSPFLVSLGKAYIENSSMTIYAVPNIEDKMKEIFRKDPNFYKKRPFLGKIIKTINTDSMNEHDYLLFIIYNLSRRSGDNTIKHYSSITNEFKRIKRKNKPGFDYDPNEKCYDHENNQNFDCPKRLFNGLQLLDVCKFIDIELMTTPVNGDDFKQSYHFKVRRFPKHADPKSFYFPLYGAIPRYSTEIREFLF